MSVKRRNSTRLILRQVLSAFAVALIVNLSVATVAAQGTKEKSGTVAPRDVRSKNFILHTDLNDDDAKELLERLEKMLGLISKYWARPNRQIIECYVVKDLKNWPKGSMDEYGWAKIAARAGVTSTSKVTQGNAFRAKSIVYAYADRGTPQHEAVHAYCGQAFGRTGPVWYSEGMAEMGQYWKEKDRTVNCSKYVVDYIRKSKPKSLNEIVNGNERTGDSWQNYAWRWALCHLLANNPNYAQRFRPLGLSLLTNGRGTFENTYGSMAKEISFEYLFFLEHLEVGLRADLIALDWKTKFRTPRNATTVSGYVNAKGGWQPSRCIVKKDTEYEYSASGVWRFQTDGDLIDADGVEGGKGKLVGVIFDDDNYGFSEPFELGMFGTWTAPSSGKLYLRCRQPWKEINDEDTGRLSFKIKLKGNGKPLPKPESRTTRSSSKS
jgi:hypothetical protein